VAVKAERSEPKGSLDGHSGLPYSSNCRAKAKPSYGRANARMRSSHNTAKWFKASFQ